MTTRASAHPRFERSHQFIPSRHPILHPKYTIPRPSLHTMQRKSSKLTLMESQHGQDTTSTPTHRQSIPTSKPTSFLSKQLHSLISKHLPSYLRPPNNIKPELIAISLVYLVQGLLGLSRLAVFIFFKDDLHLDPTSVGLLTGLGYFPWMIKPLYGFLSDSVPLWGYKRRSYLILCGGLGAVSWVALATPAIVASPATALVALLLGSATTACADVVADSIVVELSRDDNNKYNGSSSKKKDGNGDIINKDSIINNEDGDDDDDQQHTAGGLQSLCWASASVGGILSAYFSGSLVNDYGPRPVFLMTAIFPLLVSVAALAIPEQPISRSSSSVGGSTSIAAGGHTFLPQWDHMADSISSQGKALWGALGQKAILYPALFVFLWQATPTADTAMLFFETNELNFSTEFLGRIRLVAALSSLLGVGVYNFYLKKTPLKKMFFWSAILGTLLGSTQLLLVTRTNKALGLGDGAFALADSALLTVLGQVSFMPVLVLAARLCPEGVEATLFATLMSILNGGAFLGSALGSVLTGMFGVTADDYSNLAPLVLVCTLMTLAPLPLLRLVPDADDDGNGESGRRKKFDDDDVEK